MLWQGARDGHPSGPQPPMDYAGMLPGAVPPSWAGRVDDAPKTCTLPRLRLPPPTPPQVLLRARPTVSQNDLSQYEKFTGGALSVPGPEWMLRAWIRRGGA